MNKINLTEAKALAAFEEFCLIANVQEVEVFKKHFERFYLHGYCKGMEEAMAVHKRDLAEVGKIFNNG